MKTIQLLACLMFGLYCLNTKAQTEKTPQLDLLQFEVSKCDQEHAGVDIKKRIVSIETKNNMVTIVAASSANCCATINGDIQLKKSNVVNLIFEDKTDACKCICGREMKFVFPAGKYAGYELNGYKIEQSDEAVVTKRIERVYYPSGAKHQVKFFEDDVLKRIVIYSEEGEYIKTQYFKDGVLESEHTK